MSSEPSAEAMARANQVPLMVQIEFKEEVVRPTSSRSPEEWSVLSRDGATVYTCIRFASGRVCYDFVRAQESASPA